MRSPDVTNIVSLDTLEQLNTRVAKSVVATTSRRTIGTAQSTQPHAKVTKESDLRECMAES